MGSALDFSNTDHQAAGPLFFTILLMAIMCFVFLEITWLLKSDAGKDQKFLTNKRLNFIWSLIPAVVLLALTLVQTKAVPEFNITKKQAVIGKTR